MINIQELFLQLFVIQLIIDYIGENSFSSLRQNLDSSCKNLSRWNGFENN